MAGSILRNTNGSSPTGSDRAHNRRAIGARHATLTWNEAALTRRRPGVPNVREGRTPMARARHLPWVTIHLVPARKRGLRGSPPGGHLPDVICPVRHRSELFTRLLSSRSSTGRQSSRSTRAALLAGYHSTRSSAGQTLDLHPIATGRVCADIEMSPPTFGWW